MKKERCHAGETLNLNKSTRDMSDDAKIQEQKLQARESLFAHTVPEIDFGCEVPKTDNVGSRNCQSLFR